MDKKNYLRPNMEVVEVLFQLPIATSGGGDSAQTGPGSRSLNSFEDED
jgi:hypothetical protein